MVCFISREDDVAAGEVAEAFLAFDAVVEFAGNVPFAIRAGGNQVAIHRPVMVLADRYAVVGAVVLSAAAAGAGIVASGALLLGGLSYGPSIVLYIRAAHGMGARCSQMVFASVPFFGLVMSLLWLGEGLSLLQFVAADMLVAPLP